MKPKVGSLKDVFPRNLTRCPYHVIKIFSQLLQAQSQKWRVRNDPVVFQTVLIEHLQGTELTALRFITSSFHLVMCGAWNYQC